LAAGASHASRREYFVTLDGQRKAGSEVCFYAGVKDHTPFGLYFAGGAAECLSADAVLDVPSPGMFHAFARNREGYASGWRDYFVYDHTVPEKGYERYETPLIPAGWVDFSDVLPLKPGQTAGLWVSASSTTPTSFYLPLAAGETEVLVPADTTYVPMIVADRRPVRTGDPGQVGAKQTRVAKFAKSPAKGDVILWLKLDDPTSDVRPDKDYVPPVVTVESAGHSYSSSTASADSGDLTYSLLIFKDVPTGPARIVVRGKHWIDYELPLDVATGTTVRTDALIVSPAGSIDVQWGSGDPKKSQHEGCHTPAEGSERASIKIALLRCESASAVARCTPVDHAEQPFSGVGDVLFPGVLAGDYKIRVLIPGTGAQSFPVKVNNRQDARVTVPVQAFHFFGRVMVNQEVKRATLLFETGEAQSDEAGQYVADLPADPLNNQVRIIVCDTGKQFRYVPPKRVQVNAPFDITIDTATLHVVVVDAEERPVSDASVYYSPVKEKTPDGQAVVYYTSSEVTSDSEGRVDLVDAPRSRDLLVCARKGEYGSKCIDVASGSEDAVKIKFEAGGIHGRIIGHEGHAVLTWVTARGEITEQIQIPPGDGAFRARAAHDGSEYLIYVSDRRPLTALSLPPDFSPSRELDLPLPAGQVRSFVVKLSAPPSRKGYVGLFVGTRYVPMQAFATHQEFRGHDVMIGASGALPITDVLESAPIFVAFAPEPRTNTDAFVDPFTLPEFSSVARTSATGAVVIVNP
jgi:hypothetical protein